MSQRHPLADIIIAWAEGKTVEYRYKKYITWIEYRQPSVAPSNSINYEWRIKPEPKGLWVRLVGYRSYGNTLSVQTAQTEQQKTEIEDRMTKADRRSGSAYWASDSWVFIPTKENNNDR